jgi:hypothetical protein
VNGTISPFVADDTNVNGWIVPNRIGFRGICYANKITGFSLKQRKRRSQATALRS